MAVRSLDAQRGTGVVVYLKTGGDLNGPKYARYWASEHLEAVESDGPRVASP